MLRLWIVLYGLTSSFSLSAGFEHQTRDRAPVVDGNTSRHKNWDDRFCSAFIERERIGRGEFSKVMHSDVIRLQRHFDLVIDNLVANTEQSIPTLVELHTKNSDKPGQTNKNQLESALRQARQKNIERLKTYRDRGLFPQNEVAPIAIPIFVDHLDTACAVGHLMRESGCRDVVAEIESKNNFVCLADVDSGPVVEWLATSGLTLSEAALIQPAYNPRPVGDFETLAETLYVVEDLVYSDFKFNLIEDSSHQVPTAGSLRLIDLAHGDADGGFHFRRPPSNRHATRNLLFEMDRDLQNDQDISKFEFRYDIAAGDDQTIDYFVLQDYFSSLNSEQASMKIETTLSNSEEVLGVLEITEFEFDRFPQGQAIRFDPVDLLTVSTTVDMQGLTNFFGLRHEFRSVSPRDGDVNEDGAVNLDDIDFLGQKLREGSRERRLDLNRSLQVDIWDQRFLVNAILGTYIGDVNLDGQFNSSDLVELFVDGDYHDGRGEPRESTWSRGDFDNSGHFDSKDLVYLFSESGSVFEQGPLTALAVPESTESAGVAIILATILCGIRCRRTIGN